MKPLLAAALLLLALSGSVQAQDTYVVLCETVPATSGLTATLTSPGGVAKTALTGSDGVARVYYRPSPGTYRLTMQSSSESYTFSATPELTLSFRLLPPTATPTQPYTPEPWLTQGPPTETPTVAPTPLPTPVYLVWQFRGEIVMMPTLRAWTITLDIQESPVNYSSTLELLLRAIGEVE